MRLQRSSSPAAIPPRTYELLTVIQRSRSSAMTAVVPWVPSRTEISRCPGGLDPDRWQGPRLRAPAMRRRERFRRRVISARVSPVPAAATTRRYRRRPGSTIGPKGPHEERRRQRPHYGTERVDGEHAANQGPGRFASARTGHFHHERQSHPDSDAGGSIAPGPTSEAVPVWSTSRRPTRRRIPRSYGERAPGSTTSSLARHQARLSRRRCTSLAQRPARDGRAPVRPSRKTNTTTANEYREFSWTRANIRVHST